MTAHWHKFHDKTSLIAGLGQEIEARLHSALSERGQASMALSGGGTPMPLYAALAGTSLDWSKVSAMPTDERWVPVSHAANNLGQIAAQMPGTDIRLLGLVPDAPARTPDSSPARAVLATLPDTFDVVIVGMGGDGHFASLFPHSPALAEGLDPNSGETVLVVTPDPLPPEAPFARVSLSLSRLLATRYLVLLITGQGKREVFEQAASPNADPNALPIAALIGAAGSRLNVFWSP